MKIGQKVRTRFPLTELLILDIKDSKVEFKIYNDLWKGFFDHSFIISIEEYELNWR